MRFIKTYESEEQFAQMENNSGYPENAVTSIFPGFAYIKENKEVYYNEEPLPEVKMEPAPGMYSITEKHYEKNGDQWEEIEDDRIYMTFAFNNELPGPISEIMVMFDGEGQVMSMGEGQEIEINEDDYYGFEIQEVDPETQTATVTPFQLRTSGDPFVIVDEEEGSFMFQAFYSDDAPGVKYYALIENEGEDAKTEYYTFFSRVFTSSTENPTSIADMTRLDSVMFMHFKDMTGAPYLMTYGMMKRYDETIEKPDTLTKIVYAENLALFDPNDKQGTAYRLLYSKAVKNSLASLNIYLEPGKDYILLFNPNTGEIESVEELIISEEELTKIWSDSNKILFKTVYIKGNDTPYYLPVSISSMGLQSDNKYRGKEQIVGTGIEGGLVLSDPNNPKESIVGFSLHFFMENTDQFNTPEIEDIEDLDPDWPSQEDKEHIPEAEA